MAARTGDAGAAIQPRAGQAGFTLMELVIVIVLVSIAAGLFTGMFIQAIKSYQFVDAEKDMLQESRYAEERISRELKRVRGRADITQATATTFTFVDLDAATVSISWTGVKGDPLVYTKSGTARTLASGVDSLAFRYWKTDGTAATPILSPSATDIWRVSMFLRLAKNGQSVNAATGVFVRSL